MEIEIIKANGQSLSSSSGSIATHYYIKYTYIVIMNAMHTHTHTGSDTQPYA